VHRKVRSLVGTTSRESVQELENELTMVHERIRDHPFNASAFAESQAVIESMRGRDREEIQRELSARGLPRLEDGGRRLVRHAWGFWRLHRSRRLLEKRISRRERRSGG
jgi:hypothetical protein